jgi:glutathione peroxidase
MTPPKTIYDFTVRDASGNSVSLSDYRGKVVIIVNVASECGFTPQYAGLEELYRRFKDQDFVILAFPCNQFGGQEPGSEADILRFCQSKYGVTFPVFEKLEVNGTNANPLFQFLKTQASGILGSEAIKWNFTKFLVDQNGKVIARYAPTTPPADLIPEISKLLN